MNTKSSAYNCVCLVTTIFHRLTLTPHFCSWYLCPSKWSCLRSKSDHVNPLLEIIQYILTYCQYNQWLVRPYTGLVSSLTSSPLFSLFHCAPATQAPNCPLNSPPQGHVLFSLPKMLFCQVYLWLTPLPPLDLYSNTTSVRFSLSTLFTLVPQYFLPRLFSPSAYHQKYRTDASQLTMGFYPDKP